MSIPAIIIIALYVFDIGHSIVNDGKPQGNRSFVVTFIATCISIGLLYWGGFFVAV